jgi:hypothetical protein
MSSGGFVEEILRLIDSEGEKLSGNPLFTDWLQNHTIPTGDKFLFTPLAVDFVMGFRDLNRHFIRYPEPQNELELTINSHSLEDETHSKLLLRDWVSLGLDAHFRWAPRDLFWWLTCDETAQSRRIDFEFTSLIYHHTDPLLRFALVESIEVAGQVFFTCTAPLVDTLGPDDSFPYFGRYHLERETGHLQGGDERAFRRVVLTPPQRDQAAALVSRVFVLFDRHFTAWADFARRVYDRSWDDNSAATGRASAVLRSDRPHDVTAALALDHPTAPTDDGRLLQSRCREVVNELWQTPAYRWIRHAWPGDFHRVARHVLLLWVVDSWACADYFQFDTTYPEPISPVERGINRLSALYAAEMRCRYVEWETLRLDDYTGWTLAEALHHYWLDDRVEEMRAVFADLRKLTFRYREPLYRYWIMKCFVRFGDTMVNSLGVALESAGENEDDFVMFAGQPERMHPDLPADPEADAAVADLERAPLTAAGLQTIQQIIAATRDQEMARSAVTWKVINEKRFQHFDARWSDSGRPSLNLSSH